MLLQKRLRFIYAFYLEDIETPVGRAINSSIAGLVLLSSAIFVTQTYVLPIPIQLMYSRCHIYKDVL